MVDGNVGVEPIPRKDYRPMRLRPEVRRFAEAMEHCLREHDGERKDEWTRKSPRWLAGRLGNELREFRHALRCAQSRPDDHEEWSYLRDEAADCGNFLMFIVEVLGRRPSRSTRRSEGSS